MSTHEETEVVQLLYALHIRSLEDDDDDDDGSMYGDAVSQMPIFPDLMAAFTHSSQAVDAPYYNLPEGVTGSNYFMSFDKELGAVLCVNYNIPHNIIYDTSKFVAAIKAIDADIGRNFDSWINCHFEFKSGGKTFSVWANGEPDRIIAPIEGTMLRYRWNRIEEIDKVEWALNRRNDAHNIVFRPKLHAEELDRVNRRLKAIVEIVLDRGENPDENICVQDDREQLEMFKWVEAHKDRYFYGTRC
jgi:hypothetical protein